MSNITPSTGGGMSPSGYNIDYSGHEAGTVYQNTTGGPIEVIAEVRQNASGMGEAKASISVNGGDHYARQRIDLTSDIFSDYTTVQARAFIPEGQTYELDTDVSGYLDSVTIQEW